MKENYDKCYNFTKKFEGGYVWNKADPGGPTSKGVTIATLSHELGRQATIADVMGLTDGMASLIFRKSYWNAIGGDLLPLGVDLMMFDIAVNSGPGRALAWYQPIKGYGPAVVIAKLDAKRRGFWRGLKIWSVFGKGWTAREDACFKLAKSMLASG